MIWDALERAGVPDVRGVWTHEVGGGRLFLVISIKQRYLGHSRQAALVASHTQEGGYCNRWTVVVDEDIDPSNLNEVIWAMSTRCDPAQSIEILRREWTSIIDPLTSVNPNYNSRIIVDACIPFEHITDFPAPVVSSPEMRAKILEKWRDKIPELRGFGR